MASHEIPGLTDEWYTPAWIFQALGVRFALDPCSAPVSPTIEWCEEHYFGDGLNQKWRGPVWLNPPFGGRNGIRPWLEKLAAHGDGIAIVPNRTATDWFQDFTQNASGLLFIRGKVKFLRPDGSEGKSPGYGNVLVAYGRKMARALYDSEIRGLRLLEDDMDESCTHLVHRNPGLVVPCPECGADEYPLPTEGKE